MKSKGAILASPVLCLFVLVIIAADNARHVKREDAGPYHARARAAIEAYPYVIGGYWTGSEVKVPKAAVELLHPNALVSRHYENHGPGGGPQWANLLISQCADTRDMTGHYPPICYPNNGEPPVLIGSRPFRAFHVKAGDVWIDGREYQFNAGPQQGIEHKSVYDFFVVPDRGIVADIRDVRAAAGDYQRRYFGAAQFQVVMDADQPDQVRDEVFATLIGADTAVLKVLESTR